MLLATLLLMPMVWREGESLGTGRVPRRDILQFAILGVFGQVVAQLFITWGVKLSPASNGALLMLALPVSTAVMAFFVLGERMTPVRWLSFALALAGVLACSGIDWTEVNFTSGKFLVGNLLIFASVNGSAFHNVYSKKLLETYSPLRVLLYSYYAVVLFLFPVTLWLEPEGLRELPRFTCSVFHFDGSLPERPYETRRDAGGAFQLPDSVFRRGDCGRCSERETDWLYACRRSARANKHSAGNGL